MGQYVSNNRPDEFCDLLSGFPSPYGAICFKYDKILDEALGGGQFPSPYGAICFKLVIMFDDYVARGAKFPSPYGAICFKSRVWGSDRVILFGVSVP